MSSALRAALAANPATAITSGRAGVLQAAEEAGRGDHRQHRGDAGRRDGEVHGGQFGDLVARTEGGGERLRHERADDREHEAQPERQPDAVDAGADGARSVTRTEQARDGGCRGVREEDEQPDHRLQHGAGDAERGERVDAEVPDECGVGGEEQRFGHQRAERGHGEPQDPPVDRAHPTTLSGRPPRSRGDRQPGERRSSSSRPRRPGCMGGADAVAGATSAYRGSQLIDSEAEGSDAGVGAVPRADFGGRAAGAARVARMMSTNTMSSAFIRPTFSPTRPMSGGPTRNAV